MSHLSRRMFLAGSTALLGTTAAAPLAIATSNPAQLSPADTLLAWMRLAGAMDDRLVIWWMSGTRYGVVDAESRALYGMEVGIFQRFFAQPDGSWKLAMFELTYYSDLTSGKLLETFANPYTGASNRVRHVRLGPEIRQMTSSGQYTDPDDAAVKNMLRDYAATLGPATLNGDSIWIPFSVEAKIGFPKPTAPEIHLNIYTTVAGNLEDALNPETISADCSFSFQNVLKWEPWMQMGDHPGSMMSQASGKKLHSLDELPERYAEMARTVHPRLFADPMATLTDKVADIAPQEQGPVG